MEYEIKLYENGSCISHAEINKETAIKVQKVYTEGIDYEKIVEKVLRWQSDWRKYHNGALKEKPKTTEDFIQCLESL